MADLRSRHFNHLKRILEKNSPMAHEDFSPSPDLLDFMVNDCRVLVIGAGGLGCELLKDLALSGFLNIDVIDMDTIDLSNLNRQFLFRRKDIGKPKAVVAAEFINKRIAGGINVTPHYGKIQDFDTAFYEGFHVIVCGVDSVDARRWINGKLCSMLEYDKDGNIIEESIKPLIDGGTEGFKGMVRVIVPGKTPCIECNLWMYPPQVNFPMCTIAHTPRQPEHCVEYVKMFEWEKHHDKPIDGDDPTHITWIQQRANMRASQYGIQEVTYRLTQGVIKRIIPAVASTNAVVSAACVTEVFKLATQCCKSLDNYMSFNDVDGVYTSVFATAIDENCLVCSRRPQTFKFRSDDKLRSIVTYLTESKTLQMKKPTLTTMIDGKNKSLYFSNAAIPSLEEMSRANLSKTLKELGLEEGHEIVVSDVTLPVPSRFTLRYTDDDMVEE